MSRIDRFQPSPSAPDQGGQAPSMIQGESVLAHYFELARQHLGLIFGLTLAAGLIATLFAVYNLNANPIYRASAKVTVQPTDAELRFTQVYVRSSSYDSANVVTQSHMEYLHSREIAARTYNTLVERYGGTPGMEGQGLLAQMMSQIKLAIRSTIRRMNSGTFVAVTGPEAVIGAIQQSIEINMIESSFIMEIAVYWDDPDIAAEIANILAAVYQERTSEQAAVATAELTGFLEDQRALVQSSIDGLTEQRNALRAEWNVIDYGVERADLIARLASERAKLDGDRAALRTKEATIATFAPQDTNQRRDGLDEITENELSLARIGAVEYRQSILEREAMVAELERDVRRYAGYEAPLNEIEETLTRERARLADIDGRLLTVQMNQTESIEPLRLIDDATPPLYPDSPKVLKKAALGLAAGLVLALALILGLDLVSVRMTTRADLAEATGLRVLDPRRKTYPGEPYLGWTALETDGEILVLDWHNEARSEEIARRIMQSPPHSEAVGCGLLRHIRRPGYLAPDIAAVLVTLGRKEATAADLMEEISLLRQMVPSAALAVHYARAPRPARFSKPSRSRGAEASSSGRQRSSAQGAAADAYAGPATKISAAGVTAREAELPTVGDRLTQDIAQKTPMQTRSRQLETQLRRSLKPGRGPDLRSAGAQALAWARGKVGAVLEKDRA